MPASSVTPWQNQKHRMPAYKLNWPTERERLFVQAALLPGSQALAAWQAFLTASEDHETEFRPYLPAVYRHFEKQNLPLSTLPLSGAECGLLELQNRREYHLHAALLKQLAAAARTLLVFKGFGLAAVFGPAQLQRPLGDMDVYVPPEHFEPFLAALHTAGGRCYEDKPLETLKAANHAVPYLFPAGENLDLHWNVFWEYPAERFDRNLLEHAAALESPLDSVKRLDHAAHLVLICSHGLRRNTRTRLNWVLDACFLVRQAAPLDWERLIFVAEQSGVTPVLHEALSYLKKHFAPEEIPDDVLQRLAQTAVSFRQRFYLRCAYENPQTLWETLYLTMHRHGLQYSGSPLIKRLQFFVRAFRGTGDTRSFLRAAAERLLSRPWFFRRAEKSHSYGRLFTVLLKKTGFTVRSFLGPGLLSFAAALLEGCVIGLLVPMGRGLIEGRFDFIYASVPLAPLAWLHEQLGNVPATFFFCILTGFLIVLIAAKNTADYFSRLGFAANTARFQNELRKKTFESYLSAGKLFFDRENAGRLNHVMMMHTRSVANMLEFLQLAARSLFLLLIYGAVMGLISWPLLLTVSVLFPGLHFLLRRIIGQMSRISVEEAGAITELSAKAHNFLNSITLLKAYRAEHAQAADFARLSDGCEKLSVRMHRRKLAIEPVMEVVSFSIYLIVAAVAGFIILPHQPASAAAFLAFIIVLRRASSSFGIFSRSRAAAADTLGPLQEVLAVLEEPGKFRVPEGTEVFEGLKQEIRFDHLAFSYGSERKVLHDIHFSMPRGTMTALVGATGGGKTTLIHLLMRFYDCAPGSIFLDGIDVRRFTLDSLARHMALVEQEPSLFHDTLRQNLLFGLPAPVSNGRLDEVLRQAQLEDMVRALPQGLETLIGDHGVKLSGGEKQRVAIARAMLKNPDILILDEATSALDSETEAHIQKALAALISGRTCLVIAHRLSTILQADTILVLEEGRITEQGSLHELIAREGAFFRLWRRQQLMENFETSFDRRPDDVLS